MNISVTVESNQDLGPTSMYLLTLHGFQFPEKRTSVLEFMVARQEIAARVQQVYPNLQFQSNFKQTLIASPEVLKHMEFYIQGPLADTLNYLEEIQQIANRVSGELLSSIEI